MLLLTLKNTKFVKNKSTFLLVFQYRERGLKRDLKKHQINKQTPPHIHHRLHLLACESTLSLIYIRRKALKTGTNEYVHASKRNHMS